MRSLLLVSGLLVLAAGMGARTLRVGHLSDDWVILSHVSRHGNAGAWTGPWLGSERLLFHRPVFTGLYDAEFGLFGTDPFPAHLHHLLWHVAAVLLLHGILRRFGAGPGAAAFGAALFAVHPYLAGATGWLAARCGTVSATLTLLAVRVWPTTGALRIPAYGTALGASVLAALTRESGYLALVAPLTLDVVLRPGRPGLRELVRRHAGFAAAGLALLALRWASLGTLLGGYPVDTGDVAAASGPGAGAALGRAAADLLQGMPRDLVPGAPPDWMPDAAGDVLWPFERLLAPGLAVLVALAATGLLGRLRRHAAGPPAAAVLALALLLAQQVVLLAATDPTLAAATGQRWYGAVALFCGLVALLSAPVLRRPVAAAAAVLLLAFHAVGHALVQDELLAADAAARRVLSSVAGHMERAPPDTDAVFVSGLPESRKGLPLFQWGFSEALAPPFRPKPHQAPVYPIHHFMEPGHHPWPHPPVEALHYARGGRPLVINWPRGAEAPAVADARELDRRFGGPEGALAFVTSRFGGRLEALPAADRPLRLDGPPFHVPLVVETRGVALVEVFCFLPTVDMRIARRPSGERLELDLGPILGDYVRFRGEPCTLFILPLARPAGAGPKTPSLAGPLVRHRWPGPR